MKLRFEVSGQVITCPEKMLLVEGTIGEYIAEFLFNECWDGFCKEVIFTREGLQESVSIKILLGADGLCEIPGEVLAKAGMLYVYVEGKKLWEDKSVVYPTAIMPEGVWIRKSGKRDAENVTEPTPTELQQIMQKIQELQEKGISPEDIFRVVEEYVKGHREELKGERGEKGEPGERGLDGKPGATGKDGVNGKDGEPGKSAYEVAVRNGFSGTEAEWLRTLRGEKGEAGERGEKGETGERGLDGKPGAAGKDGVNGKDGEPGKSAYEVAVRNGFSGTEAEWLGTLRGEKGQAGERGEKGETGERGLDGKPGAAGKDGVNGKDGEPGKSAYEVAVRNGFSGTEAEWLRTLRGEKGEAGERGEKGETGERGLDGKPGAAGKDGVNGKDGEPGKSAYEVAVRNGFSGTEAEWLRTLRGEKGEAGERGEKGETGERGLNGEPGATGKDGVNGKDGEPGKSAYEVAVRNGFSGTEAEWLRTLRGEKGEAGERGLDGKPGAAGKDGVNGKDGEPGKSAYEVAVRNGFSGTEAEWLGTLRGEKGEAGERGEKGEPGVRGADGAPGTAGRDGKSAYEIALINGFVGTEAEWLRSIKEEDGNGNVITETYLTKTEGNELKKSVSDGKKSVASAVTAKGVTTAADATFAAIAANVAKIYTGVDTSDATAVASAVLTGKTFYAGGKKVTGTMAENGSLNATLKAGESYNIPGGHTAGGRVTASSLASQTGADAVPNDMLLNKTAYVNGLKVTGEIVNCDSEISLLCDGNSTNGAVVGGVWTMPDTKYARVRGSKTAFKVSNVPLVIGLTADKIVKGNTILGIAGTGGGGAGIDITFTGDITSGTAAINLADYGLGSGWHILYAENASRFYYKYPSGEIYPKESVRYDVVVFIKNDSSNAYYAIYRMNYADPVNQFPNNQYNLMSSVLSQLKNTAIYNTTNVRYLNTGRFIAISPEPYAPQSNHLEYTTRIIAI